MKGRALFACVVVALLLAPGAARGEAPSPPDLEEARKHYARGLQLYDQGADDAALAEFERAYRLAPSWKLLYELGVVELQLGDLAACLRYLEQYLEEGRDAVPPLRRREVEDRISRLRGQVGTLEVVTEAGAEIRIDDAPVATAPLGKPLFVNSGHHKVTASKDGRSAEERMVSITGGDRARVELEIRPREASPSPTPAATALPPVAPVAAPPVAPEPAVPSPIFALPPRPEPRRGPPPPYPLWIGWSAAGALTVGAIITGVLALHENSNLSTAKSAGPSTPGTLGSLSSSAHAFALASDLMTGTAIVAGGLTLYFTVRSSSAAAPSATVSVGVGPAGAAIGLTL
jgi:hypothetical protein